MDLREFWAANPAAGIAFSGGVDSAALLASAVEAGARVRAYFVKTELQPEFELADARRAAAALGVGLCVLNLRALDEPEIAANGPERCYFCKRRMLLAILARAGEDGFPLVVDGTNADDIEENRPGARAVRELGVLSPLRLCGLGKAAVRALARDAGLPNWDKPAYACLATRIPAGTALQANELEAVARAEAALLALGCTDLRLRRIPGGAKLQLPAAQLARAAEMWRTLRAETVPLLGQTLLLDLTPRPSEAGEEEEKRKEEAPPLHERVCELRCNVDDMSGEEAAFALERLLAAGALDAWAESIVMKKGRPALLLSCLCRPEDEPSMTALLLRHTTTLGVRRCEMERAALTRSETRRGPVRVKVSTGGGVRREKPAFDDLAAIARREGLSLREAREKYGV